MNGTVVRLARRIAPAVRYMTSRLSFRDLACEIAGTRLIASEAVTIVARFTSGTAIPVR